MGDASPTSSSWIGFCRVGESILPIIKENTGAEVSTKVESYKPGHRIKAIKPTYRKILSFSSRALVPISVKILRLQFIGLVLRIGLYCFTLTLVPGNKIVASRLPEENYK